MPINKLNELREKIDSLDKQTLNILEKRFLLLDKIRTLKTKIKDKAREKEVITHIKKNLKNKTIEPYVLELFKHLIKLSTDYQKKL